MKNIVVTFFVGFLFSCGTVDKVEAQFENKVAESFHQDWIAGVRGGGGGIKFKLKLKTELSEGAELKRVIFKGFEASFSQLDTLYYQAVIITGVNQERFEGDDKSTSSSPRSNIQLKDNEAILVFSKSGKEYQQKITNVVKKSALEYPSARPKF